MNKLRTLIACLALGIMTAGLSLAAPGKPKSVIHIVTVKWKADATKQQIDAAIKGVETLNYPGVTRVWTRPIKMQLAPGYGHVIVMEFESESALKSYTDSPAQQEWYKLYLPIRDESRTHDVTN